MVDINNPIEQLKVEQALRSELMKLDYRKKYKPDDVNILDYTVIAALQKQIPKKAVNIGTPGLSNGRCPTCNIGIGCKDNYCGSCGQKLDWSENNE